MAQTLAEPPVSVDRMDRLLIAAAIAGAAKRRWRSCCGRVVVRTPRPDRTGLPEQLDRADFVAPDRPWLVAVFTSATCATCADVQAKVEVLASDDVAVDAIEYTTRPDLHRRYRIDAVPVGVRSPTTLASSGSTSSDR